MSRLSDAGLREPVDSLGANGPRPYWTAVKLWLTGSGRSRKQAKPEPCRPTGNQVQVGRKLLGWTVETLANRSMVSRHAVERAERSAHERPVEDGELAAIGAALEAAGIEFVGDLRAGAGVRLSWGIIPQREDQRSSFERLVDDNDLLFVLLYALGWEPSDYLLGNRWSRYPK